MLRALNQTRGTCLARRVEVADSSDTRTKGLLGRAGLEPDSGLWHHRRATRGPAMSLDEISYASGRMQFENRRRTEPVDLARHLASAHELFHAAGDRQTPTSPAPQTNIDFETLRWFPYAQDVAR